MALEKIHLRPGVTVELTPTLNEAGFSVSQLVRFFAGQLQKYGGWARLPGVDQMLGVCRGLSGWADLVGTAHVAAGTDQRLYVLTAGRLADITPTAATSNLSPLVSTVAGSTTVTIADPNYTPKPTDTVNITTPISRGGLVLAGFYPVITQPVPGQYTITAARAALTTTPPGGQVPLYTTVLNSATVTVLQNDHGLVVGSSHVVPVSVSVGGLVLLGNYTVTSVIDPTSFTVTAGSLATSSATVAMNGNLMQIIYLLSSGVGSNVSLGGWGTGDWGAGDYGQSTAGIATALVVRARTWSLDHFGQDLVASPDLGKIYHWSPPTIAPAVVLSGAAPVINKVVFAIAQVQIIMACGSEVGGLYFPTLIRWCDQGDFTTWVASTTNQAGSFQLPTGSSITAAIALGLGALIWTDVGLWAVTYQGLPFVFSFNQIAVDCEAISKKAPAVVGSAVVWPSSRGFFKYDGNGANPLACPVYDFFYNNLNFAQADQVCSGVNSLFNEVAWFFPTKQGTIAYIKMNYLENVWDYGTLPRTAWVDRTPYGGPLATDAQGYLYNHEIGDDADGSPMTSYAQSGYYDLADGNAMSFVNTMIPDFLTDDPTTVVQITVLATDYPGDPPRSYGPFTITSTLRRINTSIRGRQIAFRIGSVGLGGWWRMGAVRYARKPAGTRP